MNEKKLRVKDFKPSTKTNTVSTQNFNTMLTKFGYKMTQDE